MEMYIYACINLYLSRVSKHSNEVQVNEIIIALGEFWKKKKSNC